MFAGSSKTKSKDYDGSLKSAQLKITKNQQKVESSNDKESTVK